MGDLMRMCVFSDNIYVTLYTSLHLFLLTFLYFMKTIRCFGTKVNARMNAMLFLFFEPPNLLHYPRITRVTKSSVNHIEYISIVFL